MGRRVGAQRSRLEQRPVGLVPGLLEPGRRLEQEREPGRQPEPELEPEPEGPPRGSIRRRRSAQSSQGLAQG